METFTEIERRRLLAILGENKELAALACSKIFTASKDCCEWLDSDLEGFLCFVIDHSDNSRYLVLYETTSYEKLFQVELYVEFHKYYTVQTDTFHSFELSNGIVGLKFENGGEALRFADSIKKMTDDKKILLNRKDKYKKSKDIIELLVKKFSTFLPKKNLKNEFFGDEGMDICKPKHFSLLTNISFDKSKQRFIMGDIPQDLKRLFKLIGIKKSDFKDTEFALNIFKILIQAFECLQKEKRDKSFKLCKIDGKLLITKERNNSNPLVKKTSLLDYKHSVSNILNEEVIKTSSQRPSAPFIPSVPQVPSVPKVPVAPTIPKFDPPVSTNVQIPESKTPIVKKQTDESSRSSNSTQGSIQEQMGKVILKPVDNRPVKVNQAETGFIKNMNPLQLAIQQRREKIIKGNVSSEESGNEWSDDD